MEETNTTDLSLNNTTYGDYAGSPGVHESWCVTEKISFIIRIACIGVSLCGIVGNMVVVCFLGFQMKRNPFTAYVLNLVVADISLLFFLIVRQTLDIIDLGQGITLLQNFWISSTTLFVFLTWYAASMYLLVAISTERCLLVLFPIWYQCHRPRHLSGFMCGVLWAVPGLYVSLFSVRCFIDYSIECNLSLQVVNTVNFLLFSLLQIISNLFLFINLRCGSERRHPGRLYMALLSRVIFLFIFGLSFTVTLLLYNERQFPCFFLLSSLVSTINPFIYFLVGSCRQCCFQGSLTVALRRVFEDKTTSEEGTPELREPVGQTSL